MLMLPKYINLILLSNIKRNIRARYFSLTSYKRNQVTNNDVEIKQFSPIFKTSHMAFFIGLNRLKMYQTTALFFFIPSCIGLNMFDYFNFEEAIAASLIGIGLTAGLHFVSIFLSNNNVVFVYLNEDKQECQFSYISYWGKRRELYCNIEDIKSIQYSKYNFSIYKIKLKNGKTLKIIIRNATIFSNDKFRKIFGNDII